MSSKDHQKGREVGFLKGFVAGLLVGMYAIKILFETSPLGKAVIEYGYCVKIRSEAFCQEQFFKTFKGKDAHESKGH